MLMILVDNIWNMEKTAEINILGEPFIAGNFWSNYEGIDFTGDKLGDTLTPFNSNGNIQNGGDQMPLTEFTTETTVSSGGGGNQEGRKRRIRRT